MMEVVIALIINFGLPLGLLALALITGRTIEKRHFADIAKREAATAHRPAMTARGWDADLQVDHAELAQGSVVVSIDYFKRFMGGLHNLVGGRVRSFESILDRGRREAILRMKESSPQADLFVNMRLETSMLASTTTRGQYLGGIEVIAYATAVHYRKDCHREVYAETTR